ncbi:MAG: hypothetical protein K9J13_03940 [Saprospiraceae bacterium]|nr:hypothetical protein [Saprospiraceae bacterium]
MQKDKLESFIVDNKNQFDDLEPSAELWNKIDKANQETRQKVINIRKINWNSVLWKAASVVIIFIASYFVHDFINKPTQLATQDKNSEQIITNNEEFSKLFEAEAYYVSKINTTKSKLFNYADEYPGIKNDINNDMLELDSIYAELKNDLNENIANEQVIDAMIQNYRIKLEILEEVLSIIERSKNNKKPGNSDYYETSI